MGLYSLRAGEPAEKVRGDPGLHQELIDVMTDIFVLGASYRFQLGPVRPEDAALRAHDAQADGGVVQKLTQLGIAFGQVPLACHQLGRAAMLATTVTSSEGCTGFDRCN